MKWMFIAMGFGLAASAVPCCGVGPINADVKFRGQQNIIIWDEETSTEVFVRDAQFDSESKDVGFIAPTPTIPKLSEAKESAFELLQSLKPQPKSLDWAAGQGESVSAAPTVEVLGTQEVSGYTATILKANDAQALQDWLTKNGYTTAPDVEEWIEFYVQKDWIFTAFKVSKKSGTLSTGPVTMTFKTAKPYNPFRVPKSNWGKASLQLFWISKSEHRPVRPDGYGGSLTEMWSAKLPPYTANRLAESVSIEPSLVPANAHVVAYFDSSFPGKAMDDLYFEPGRNPSKAGTQTNIGMTTYIAVGAGILLLVAFRVVNAIKK